MAQRLNNLNDIVSTLRTGAGFYRKAARQTNRPDREELFREHAALRETHARTLADMIEDVGGEVRDVQPAEKAREVVSRLFAWTGQTDRALVLALEEHEDRTQQMFRKAIQHRDNDRDVEVLEPMMREFEEAHARMRALKHRFGSGSAETAGPVRTNPDQPATLRADPPTPDDPARHTRRGEEDGESRPAA